MEQFTWIQKGTYFFIRKLTNEHIASFISKLTYFRMTYKTSENNKTVLDLCADMPIGLRLR
jgi:hypothetical protein